MKLNTILLFVCCMLLGRTAQAGVIDQNEAQQAASMIKHFTVLAVNCYERVITS